MYLYLTSLVLFYIISPAVILYLCQRYTILERIGSILIAYALGLLIGNIGIFPHAGEYYQQLSAGGRILPVNDINNLLAQGLITSDDLLLNQIRHIQNLVIIVTIPLALPLLLFSSNIRQWLGLAKETIFSLLIAVLALVIVIVSGYFMFNNGSITDLWKISGMMAGLYTGGSPNLAALKIMLDVDPDTYILTHTIDTVVCAVLLFFLMSVGKTAIRWFLPKFKGGSNADINLEGYLPAHIFLKKETAIPLLKAVGFSALIFAISGLLSLLVPENLKMMVIVLSITTFSLFISMIPTVNKARYTFELGMYFILIFSIAVASMADVSRLLGASITLVYYVSYVVFGSLILHVLLAKIFKVDADTVIITATALACSPPFVPMMANSLKNKAVIISGITAGILGYAIGNYLGILIAEFMKNFG